MDDECPLSGMCSNQLPFLCDLINSFVPFVGGRSNLFVDFSQLAEFLKVLYCWAMPALSCAAICPFLVTVLATEGANILKFARAVPQKGSFTAQHTILCTPSAHHPLLTTLCHPERSEGSPYAVWGVVSGFIGLYHRAFFGFEFKEDGLNFSPYVPKELKGERS